MNIIPKEIPYFDKKGDEYFKNTIQETIAIYGIVRITNALVSVAKETEIEVTPVGVGLTLHIGQFLDPLDDATERLSTILTISLAILGLMKIFKEILTIYTFKFISYILILFLPIIWIEKLKKFYLPILSLIILILGLRFSLPFCGIINNYLYINFFQPKLEESKKVFTELKNLDNEKVINDFVPKYKEDKGLFSSFKSLGNSLNFIKDKISLTKKITQYIWDNKGKILNAIINIIILEISLIFIQVIILPLSVLYFLLKVSNLFNNPNE